MTELFTATKSKLSPRFLLGLIFLIGAFLRLYHLNFQSVWDDELATLIETDPTLKFADAIETHMTFDNMPPLYLLLLRYLFVVFGHSAMVLRLFSALLGTAAIGAMYLLGKSLYNQKAGIGAAFIFALNYFQIYYSQEGRPYTFLTLFTILSFYRLVLYFQHNSLKNVLYYALFTLLMLYGQYVALFILAAQGLLIILFLWVLANSNRWRYFWHFFLAMFLIAIGYIPALPQLIKNAGIQSSWIPFPPLDVFTQYLSEFFGRSEFLLALIYLLVILFFARVASAGDEKIESENKWPAKTYTFLIIGVWLVVYMLIPLIRTYTTLPILVPRYFNPLIPAVCLMAGIGLVEIKNKFVQYTVALLFFVFTAVDLFVVKKYYGQPTKAQYRENAAYVISHLNKDEPLVTTFWWHYQYFFKPVKAEKQIQYGTLDLYIHKLQSGGELPASFWYLATHEKVIQLSPENKIFIQNNYVVERKANFHEVSAIHYVKKTAAQTVVQFNQCAPLQANENNELILDGSQNIIVNKQTLEKGVYRFYVCAKNLPEHYVNNIPAHLSLKINGNFAGGFFVQSGKNYNTQSVVAIIKENGPVTISLLFDNDFVYQNLDRNVAIISIYYEKI